ncbi:rRNA processing protein Rrp36 [Schizosaccharomyces osmophilus]|uniref:rRNA biogenesis protein RRP36 n=1 Tax=Schizosaccharomyces osmophilus TaxID=2545709 RepID=A0AAE9WBV8_9SCHI|nr:rRNA processing protein Rrp36 [Schizosaccharomyces osmophilus]WBW73451.1 rRNA processing protein Rrp36 [Schizosaccharomyces osmophilus]
MSKNALKKGSLAHVNVEEDDPVSSSDELVSEEEFNGMEESEPEAISDVDEKSAKTQISEIPFDTLLAAQKKLMAEQNKTEKKESAVIRKKSQKRDEHEAHERAERKKHAPMEVSSKKPVTRFREVVNVPKKFTRDPRFDSLSGSLNKEKVKNNYSFVFDYRKKEIELLREELKKCKDPERAETIKTTLKSLLSKMERHIEEERTGRVLREQRANEREQVKEGKKPFYMKKSDQKKLVQLDKYKSMEGTKKLDRYLENKMRRRAQKEKKRLPRARSAPSSSS